MTTEELIAARRAEPWREALRKSKKNKERADIPRVKMNELDRNTGVVPVWRKLTLGLTKRTGHARGRALFGLSESTCMQGCPVNINIPTFIKNIERGEFLEAAKTLKDKCPARCLRSCLSAGETMREQVYPI